MENMPYPRIRYIQPVPKSKKEERNITRNYEMDKYEKDIP